MDDPCLVPFAGDTIFAAEFQRICNQYKINTIIETGTYQGATTLEFAKMAPIVHTIEINNEWYQKALGRLKDCKNVRTHLGNSVQLLPGILKDVEQPVAFFIDSHWYEDLPLKRELEIIAEAKLTDPIVIVHDCLVPGHPELGYDVYGGVPISFETMEKGLNSIYKNGCKIQYNTEATGAKRGILYCLA